MHANSGSGIISSHNCTQRILALRLLAACCQHGTFVKEAFILPSNTSTAGLSFLQSLAKLLLDKELEEMRKEELARVLVMIFVRAVKEGEGHVRILMPAIDCWTAAMSHRKVRKKEGRPRILTATNVFCEFSRYPLSRCAFTY